MDLGFKDADIPALLHTSERVTLYSLIVGLRPKRVLEIGTRHGGSARIMVKAMDDAKEMGMYDGDEGRLICVDPAPELRIDWNDIAHRATLLLGYSPDILPEARERAGGDFDLCFIDGDHHYVSAWRDGTGVLPYVSPGGYLLFHDAYHPDVALAIDDLVSTISGLVDCGIVCQYKALWDHDRQAPMHVPAAGLRLVRVQSKGVRWMPRRVRYALQKVQRNKAASIGVAAALAGGAALTALLAARNKNGK